jgi:hypothetical protein
MASTFASNFLQPVVTIHVVDELVRPAEERCKAREAEGVSPGQMQEGTTLQRLESVSAAQFDVVHAEWLVSTYFHQYTIRAIQISTEEFCLMLGQGLRAKRSYKAPGAGCHSTSGGGMDVSYTMGCPSWAGCCAFKPGGV